MPEDRLQKIQVFLDKEDMTSDVFGEMIDLIELSEEMKNFVRENKIPDSEKVSSVMDMNQLKSLVERFLPGGTSVEDTLAIQKLFGSKFTEFTNKINNNRINYFLCDFFSEVLTKELHSKSKNSGKFSGIKEVGGIKF